MPDIYQYTRYGYQVVDPDDAPTPEEQFIEYLAWIWQEASAPERIAITHERHALGIRDKSPRELTATEQAVVDTETAYLKRQAEWEAAEDARRIEAERQYWATHLAETAADDEEWDGLPY